MKRDLLDRLIEARAARRPAALLTNLKTGEQHLFLPADGPTETTVATDLAAAAEKALAHDRSASFDMATGRTFIHVHNPPPRMIVVGAVHIAQPLVRMATLAGYAVTVIDPRRAFASAERFPDVAVSRDWPDAAMRALAPDSRTAVVTLTHDPKLDDPALDVALRSPAFYIGSLGSARTHAKRCARLVELGHDDEAIARIHSPIGLSIGARSPAEIAVSIMAEITQIRRRGTVRSETKA